MAPQTTTATSTSDSITAAQKITPFLWFDNQAEEAAKFYVSVFENSRITQITRYQGAAVAEVSGMPTGSVMTVAFDLAGQPFTALNGGPEFTFSPAISFVVNCETQEELDRYWDALSASPQDEQCGWLKDRFGVSWQIVPTTLGELISGPDTAASERAMKAMLQMKRIDIAALRAARSSG